MSKFHNSENGPRPCKAQSPQTCPIKDEQGKDVPHYSSKEEAQKAYEKKLEARHSVIGGLFKKNKNTFTAHIQKADKKVKAAQNEIDRRNARQFNDTVHQELLRDQHFDENDFKKLLETKLNQNEAGIGVLDVLEGDDEVIGVSYNADYRYEEEQGLRDIHAYLEKGQPEKGAFEYVEVDGKGVLNIRGSSGYSYGDPAEIRQKNQDKALDTFKNHRRLDSDLFRAELYYSRLSVAQLREKLKGKVKPLPKTKDDLVKAAAELKYPAPKDQVKTPQGEFHNGKSLSIVSDNPTMMAMMKKTVESHDNGTLRMGSSANPFSRATMFYDERDISGRQVESNIRQEEANDAAINHVSSETKKMEQNGELLAISPQLDVDGDVRESQYYINYLPKGNFDQQAHGIDRSSNNIYGWYSKEDMEKIANNDFTPFVEWYHKR